jgi:hypothetical protein
MSRKISKLNIPTEFKTHLENIYSAHLGLPQVDTYSSQSYSTLIKEDNLNSIPVAPPPPIITTTSTESKPSINLDSLQTLLETIKNTQTYNTAQSSGTLIDSKLQELLSFLIKEHIETYSKLKELLCQNTIRNTDINLLQSTDIKLIQNTNINNISQSTGGGNNISQSSEGKNKTISSTGGIFPQSSLNLQQQNIEKPIELQFDNKYKESDGTIQIRTDPIYRPEIVKIYGSDSYGNNVYNKSSVYYQTHGKNNLSGFKMR